MEINLLELNQLCKDLEIEDKETFTKELEKYNAITEIQGVKFVIESAFYEAVQISKNLEYVKNKLIQACISVLNQVEEININLV